MTTVKFEGNWILQIIRWIETRYSLVVSDATGKFDINSFFYTNEEVITALQTNYGFYASEKINPMSIF